jgi:hypothetical protein
MTCPNCNSEDTCIVTTYTRRWTVLIFPDRRVSGDGDVERTHEDKLRCLDCGHEWRDGA